MMKIFQYISVIFLISLLSCENNSISPEQAETFFKMFGGFGQDKAYDVKSLSDGGYILTGFTSIEDKQKEVIIIRTDKFGNEVWPSKTFGGTLDDEAYSIQILEDGGFVILGSTIKDTGSGPSNTDMYLIRVNHLGELQWSKTFGGNQNEVGYQIKQTSDGGFILIGYTESFGQGAKDVRLVKTNAEGDTLWTRTHGGSNNDIGKCIVETSYGYIFTGSTSSFSEPGQAGSNIFVVKVNSLGKEIFPFTYGGLNDDSGESIIPVSDGYVIGASIHNNAALIKVEEDLSKISWTNQYTEYSGFSFKSMKALENGGFVCVGTLELSSLNHMVIVLKTDSQGKKTTTGSFGGTGIQSAEAIDLTKDGGFIITGSNTFEGNSMISLIKASGNLE
jgi:hypothetical protein